ncbi:MAG: transposase [Spirochaetia bacterium]|nr:transposase [Spirochaetia bacterium]
MKQENHLWGCHRIADELKKLRIDLHPTTVNKIVQTFRKNGKIQPNGSWKKFLKAHWDTLFAMDYATIDTLFGKRLYLLLIIQLHSRKIVTCKLTQYPCREFVRQQIIDFSQSFSNSYLIHDNDSQFTSINFFDYGINGVTTCVASPNMNVYIERFIGTRFIGTLRREAFDNFLVISEKQIKHIIENYVRYYNNQRPHQGLNRIPENPILEKTGRINRESVLSGLHLNYFRSSA